MNKFVTNKSKLPQDGAQVLVVPERFHSVPFEIN